MAKVKTPELIEIKGHRVYRVPLAQIAIMQAEFTCEHCPFVVNACGKDVSCGLGYRLVKEDVWLKLKLRG